jgi:YfiH family protein
MVIGHEFALGPGVRAVVTDRHGGVSTGPYATLNLGDHVGDDPAAVASNRAAVAAALGVPGLVITEQVHGATVAIVGSADDAVGPADALVTDVPGVAVAVLVADCTPVVLWDPVARAVGVVHSGRPGAVLDVVGAAVSTMASRFGTEPTRLRVGVGPCVAQGSYEVGPAEVAAVREAFPGMPALLTPTHDGHACFDLPGAVLARLAAAGVQAAHVERVADDTRTTTGRWFSDRAARPCGRFALVAVVSDAAT